MLHFIHTVSGRGCPAAHGQGQGEGQRSSQELSGEERRRPQGSDAERSRWATEGGQGPSEVGTSAAAGQVDAALRMLSAKQMEEEEARVPDACREQRAVEDLRERPRRPPGEKNVVASHEGALPSVPGQREQGSLRGGDNQQDHQEASLAAPTNAEDNASAGLRVREAKEDAGDHGIRWVALVSEGPLGSLRASLNGKQPKQARSTLFLAAVLQQSES